GIGEWVPLGKVHWLVQMSMFLIPVALYGLLILGQSFPKSEAGQAGVGFGTMLLQVASPLFLMLLLIQAMVGYVELGTDSWISKITGSILNNANYGMLLFIYTSGLMFILRFFGGPIEHKLSPLGLLCASGVLGAIGLTLLGHAEGAFLCVLAATVYALGKTFLWPTMLAVASERFPKGGAITIGAVGGVGMLSAGLLGGPGIGFKQDFYASEELKKTHVQTYDRYKSDEENSFLVVFKVRGLDGSKTNLLELASKVDGDKKDLAEPKITKEKQKDLEGNVAATEKEMDAALKNASLAKWWTGQGEPHKTEDKKPVEEAGLFGGRMALQFTAAVPAIMAVLYLLLILYFKATGGYKKEVVLTTAAPASEF
ncbi:MAG TPA: MFS transporter, partial [Gemmataceae bacterium]|nr:MFS transporter [Gemmataceae bacterium]